VFDIREVYSSRCCIMVQRVRIAGSVRGGNFLKIHFHAFPSSLYTRKRCSSISSHGIFFLALPLVLTATSVIVAAGIGIAVAQTVIIADCNRTRSRCHSSAATPKSGSRNIAARGMCLRVQWQSRHATSREPGRGMLADAGQKE
jgi:hypothetical protein